MRFCPGSKYDIIASHALRPLCGTSVGFFFHLVYIYRPILQSQRPTFPPSCLMNTLVRAVAKLSRRKATLTTSACAYDKRARSTSLINRPTRLNLSLSISSSGTRIPACSSAPTQSASGPQTALTEYAHTYQTGPVQVPRYTYSIVTCPDPNPIHQAALHEQQARFDSRLGNEQVNSQVCVPRASMVIVELI